MNTEKTLVKTGDILIHEEGEFATPYEVIIADERFFVVGETDGTHTTFDQPMIYSNLPSINTLAELGFQRVEKEDIV